MKLESSGMLVVCGTDKFQGVEYVCCPKGEMGIVCTVTGNEPHLKVKALASKGRGF